MRGRRKGEHMDVIRWADTNRERLARLLPEAVVVMPLGATEQHGPHLPTGTDALLATEVAERAASIAAADATRDFVVAPSLRIGASDHHHPFGGTLSLRSETLLSVVLDIAHSVVRAGGRRLVLINGHGGNSGVCHAAAAAASARWDVAMAHLDYWDVADRVDAGDVPVPGHAGAFETSMVLALRPELVAPRPRRETPPPLSPANLHSADVWRRIDGYTDQPERANAARGEQWLSQISTAVAERLVELAGEM
jgi:creatinine amidohydrolase